MTTENTKLTINLDSTSLSNSGCIRALKHVVVDGYTELLPAANLIYGVAVHKFIDTMYKSRGDYSVAKAEALRSFDIPKIDNNKSSHLSDRNHMIATCFHVWEGYIKDRDKDFELLELVLPCWKCRGSGELMDKQEDKNDIPTYRICNICNGQKQLPSPSTEVTFSIRYYEDEYIIVNLCGTIDRIGKIKNGCYCIRDWKTTSGWNTGDYFRQYELSRQLRMYKLALRLMSSLYPSSVLGQLGATNVGCIIDAIFLKPAANDVKVMSSDVMMVSDKELDAFQLTLDDKIKELSLAIKTGYYPKQGILNGACLKQYGKCQFWNCCGVSDEIGEILLKRDFKQRIFNPLNYNE